MRKYKRKFNIFFIIVSLLKTIVRMKKYSLKPQTFGALIFSGAFDEIDSAANAAHPGSGTTFSETEDEKGKTLTFTDALGNTQVALEGDALKETFDGETFTGYTLVPAAVVAADWVEETGE